MPRPLAIRPYVAEGFEDDCDELVHRCIQVETLTYHTFCDIWKNMNISALYNDRNSHAEIAELSEEVLQVAKQYLVADTSNFTKSLAGLFLVYALQNLQPYEGFAALRLVPDDVPAIRRLEVVARRERRYDVLFILGSVLIQGPCQFHVAQRERGMEQSLRKYLDGFSSADKQVGRPKGVFYRQNVELDLTRELSSLSKQYTEAKKIITGFDKDPSLSYFDPNLASELNTSLKTIICGIIPETENTKKSPKKPPSSSPERHDMIQSIKSKAMKDAVKSIGHLTGVNERNKQLAGNNIKDANKRIKKRYFMFEDSPQSKVIESRSNLKRKVNNDEEKNGSHLALTSIKDKQCSATTTGNKVKSGSPKKPLVTSSPRKAKNAATLCKKKKTKKTKYMSSSSSESDDNAMVLVDETDTESLGELIDAADEIDESDLNISTKVNIDMIATKNLDKTSKDLDSLPSIITIQDQDQRIEIGNELQADVKGLEVENNELKAATGKKVKSKKIREALNIKGCGVSSVIENKSKMLNNQDSDLPIIDMETYIPLDNKISNNSSNPMNVSKESVKSRDRLAIENNYDTKSVENNNTSSEVVDANTSSVRFSARIKSQEVEKNIEVPLPINLRKPNKTEQKNDIVKSKFKKMGILEVAGMKLNSKKKK